VVVVGSPRGAGHLYCAARLPVPSSQPKQHRQARPRTSYFFKAHQQPVWLSSHTLSPWGLPDLLFGGVLIGYAGRQLGLEIGDYLLSAAVWLRQPLQSVVYAGSDQHLVC